MSTQLTSEQRHTLGMNTLSQGQQDDFLERVGRSVFDSALVALIETLNDDQIYALNHALEENESFESVLEYLQVTYPSFTDYMEDAQKQFQAKVQKQMQQVA